MSTVASIGAVIAVIIGIGAVVFIIGQVRAGRPEAGAEIELAPNRKPYYEDEKLETTVLDRTLRWAAALMVVVAVGLPLYWLNEPGRMSGAEEAGEELFAARGEEQFVEGSACADCHGPDAVGGVTSFALLEEDAEGNQSFVANVQWRAPALNTVLLRFSEEEVEDIIATGRPGTPMPGWSADAGTGPLNEQQIDNLVDYLKSIQLSPEEAQRAAQIELATRLGLLEEGESDEAAIDRALEQIDYQNDPRVGQELFNLGRETGFAGGAYSCARCHTKGWSIVQDPEQIEAPTANPDLSNFVGFPDGSGGALGPNITGGLLDRKFATFEQLVDFVVNGSTPGEGFGNGGIGSGRMPGFGFNPNDEETEDDGMLTREMIEAITRYEDSLSASGEGDQSDATGAAQPQEPGTPAEAAAGNSNPNNDAAGEEVQP